MSATLELFVCVPLAARLTRASCAARHQRAAREVRHASTKGQQHLVGNIRCAECAIGAAHVHGEAPAKWPDGAALELAAPLGSPNSPAAPRAPRSEEYRDHQPLPPTSGDRGAPRAAKPTYSRSGAGDEASGTRPPAAELAEGEPGAGPGARAAERTAAERPGRDTPESTSAGGAGRAPIARSSKVNKPITSRRRSCESCGATYQPTGNRQQRCAPCGRERKAKYSRDRKARLREQERAQAKTAPPSLQSAPKRTNGRAIQERLQTCLSQDDLVGPALALEAAGYRVLSRQTVPAGLMLVVEVAPSNGARR